MIVGNVALLVVIGIVLLALALGLVVAPFLKRKGWVKPEDLAFTGQLLEILQAVITEVEFRNYNTKEHAILVIDIIHTSAKYVEQMMSDKTVEEKRDAAKNVALAMLAKAKIPVDDNRKQLIESSLNLLIK